MFKNIFFTFLFAICIISCSADSQKDNTIDINLAMFDTVYLNNSTEVLAVEEMHLAKPLIIKYIEPDVLILGDNYRDYLFQSVDLKNGKTSKLMKRGTSANQILRVDNLWNVSDTLYYLDTQENKIGYYIWQDQSDPKFQILKKVEEPIMRAISLDDHNFIYLPFEHGIRLKKGTLTNITDVYTEFPYSDNQDSGSLNNSLFQSYISFSPDRSNIVLATLTWNIIEVYNGDLKQRFIIKGPDEIDSNLAERNVGGMSVLMQTSPWNYYRGIACSNSQFMVGYIGVPLTDRESYQCGIRSILSFDWNGTPLKEYKLDKELDAFDIDFATMTLYGLVNTPYPHIVKYNLNK